MTTLRIIPYNAVGKPLAQDTETLNEQCEETKSVLPHMEHHASKEHPEEHP
jgi:hypothetical protein